MKDLIITALLVIVIGSIVGMNAAQFVEDWGGSIFWQWAAFVGSIIVAVVVYMWATWEEW